MSSRMQFCIKILWFYMGLVILVTGFTTMARAGLGASPWDVFHLGLHERVGGQLALVMQVTSLFIVLLNLLLGIRPSLGMILNMLTIGPLFQFLYGQLPTPATLIGQWMMLLVGIFTGGLGIALYTSADLGSGPRDGLMIGLTRKLGLPVGVVKNGIDMVIAFLGWRLGGPLGLGTVVVALGMGPAVQLGLRLVTWLSAQRPFHLFVRPVSLKRS
jgi:uncharacterized membrane protein YczE